MDLAREVQVYSDSTQVSYLSPSPDHECEYVEQEGSLTIPRSGSTDDGYVSSVSCSSSCSEVSLEEETDSSKISSSNTANIDVKRLKKNEKQREREWKKKVYITRLKSIIIASDLVSVQPKGRRQFTEYNTLKYTKELIEMLMSTKKSL